MKKQFKPDCPQCKGSTLANVVIDKQLQVEPVAVECAHCKELFVFVLDIKLDQKIVRTKV